MGWKSTVSEDYCTCTQGGLMKPISETEYECFDCGKEIRPLNVQIEAQERLKNALDNSDPRPEGWKVNE